MVMTCATGMGDAVLRERLPALWRRIEDTHYSYLETDDSPEKLQQKEKLEDYIIEYLSLVPHECKFGLAETGKVFQRTINELSEFSAYRAGLGWAALARYAGNLLAQPWRKEYKVIRLYCGYYKHEVEANMVGAETLLHAMGYKSVGSGRLALDAPICPDMVAAVSRDALIAQCECQIMSQIWEAVWGSGARVSWADVARERVARAASAAAAAARLAAPPANPQIYSNVPVTVTEPPPRNRYHAVTTSQCNRVCPEETSLDEPITPIMHPPYMMPSNVISPMMYPIPHPHMHSDVPVTVTSVPMMTPYGVPYYYPVQAPYMIPTPVYAPIKHATNVPLNGYPPIPQYRYPTVPTAQLIELDSPSVYENGKFERHRDEERGYRKSRQPESSRRNSTSKSNFSDISLPSLPRSDTQPTLSKAREDGMGTYESWDYVFRNLSSKEQDTGDSRSRYSPSLDRDSRTLDRLDREERRVKYQPTTLDLEDGLQAMNLDRSYDDEVYRTAKVNENLMRMKQEQELKRTKHLVKKQVDERRTRKLEPIGNPKADALIPAKVAPDKVKLLTKKDIKDRKDVIKQQNSINGSISNTAEVKKVKKPTKHVAIEVEKSSKSKPLENGVHNVAQSSKSNAGSNYSQANYDLKAQLIVTLDEPDSPRRSPPKQQNGDRSRPTSRASARPERPADRTAEGSADRRDAWECSTCTYLNKGAMGACEMCGKSRRPPSIQPLTSGGRECPACTLVNRRDAVRCDACGTGLDHCPTYI
ncbi:LOW QUALITY PROTEIN: PUB and ZnF_RBZ domain-containing protein tamozhennic [Aphomia sociella]